MQARWQSARYTGSRHTPTAKPKNAYLHSVPCRSKIERLSAPNLRRVLNSLLRLPSMRNTRHFSSLGCSRDCCRCRRCPSWPMRPAPSLELRQRLLLYARVRERAGYGCTACRITCAAASAPLPRAVLRFRSASPIRPSIGDACRTDPRDGRLPRSDRHINTTFRQVRI